MTDILKHNSGNTLVYTPQFKKHTNSQILNLDGAASINVSAGSMSVTLDTWIFSAKALRQYIIELTEIEKYLISPKDVGF